MHVSCGTGLQVTKPGNNELKENLISEDRSREIGRPGLPEGLKLKMGLLWLPGSSFLVVTAALHSLHAPCWQEKDKKGKGKPSSSEVFTFLFGDSL